MLTNIAHTSLQAYDSFTRKELQDKEIELLAIFDHTTRLTREAAARVLGWKEASVCGRANSLVAMGVLAEIDGGRTASGRHAKILMLPRVQLELV